MPDAFTWSARCRPPSTLVRPVRLDPAGLDGPTRGQARGKAWRQTSHGFYVPSQVDPDVPEQRILEASALLAPGGAVTGWAACRWRGAGYFDGVETDGRTHRPVPLAVGPGRSPRAQSGIVVRRDRLDPEDTSLVRGMPCARAERALFDEMRAARDVREAAVSMDMMAAAELTSIERMRSYCRRRTGWNGLPRVRRALDLADENSMSPNESRLRLVWVLDAGLPPPLCNQPVFDLRGDLIGVADLLDPVAGVVGEFDGAAHRGARRHRRDVMREDRFRRAGLEYLKVVGLDLDDVDLVVDRISTTRARARFATPTARRWTLDAPGDRDASPLETASLDERLSYREWLRGEQYAG